MASRHKALSLVYQVALLVLVVYGVAVSASCSANGVEGLAVTASVVQPSETTTIALSASAGTCLDIVYDLGDSSSLQTRQYPDHTSITNLTYNYATVDPATYIVSATLDNAPEKQTVKTYVFLDLPIQGLTATYTHALFGTKNTFTVSANQGTRLTVFVDYGNMLVEERFFSSAAGLGQFEMEYTTPGRYHVSVYVFNSYDVTAFCWEVYCVREIPPLTVSPTSPALAFIPGQAASNATFELMKQSPLNKDPEYVTCTWDYGDDSWSEDVPTNITNDIWTITHQYLEPGNYTVAVNCSNFASEATPLPTQVRVEEAIQVSLFTSDVTVVLRDDPMNFVVVVTHGTTVYHQIDFGDGTLSTHLWHETLYAQGSLVNTTHAYSAAGNYSVSVVSTNAIDSATTGLQHDIVVQDPVQFEVSAARYVDVDLDVMFNLTAAPLARDDLTCDWDFDDDNATESHYTLFPTVVRHKYSSVGDKRVLVTCHNLVQSLMRETVVTVQRPVSSLTTVGWPPHALTNSPIRFTARLATGSHAKIDLSYGLTGTPATFDHPNQLNSTADLPLDLVFVSPGNYTITIDAYNDVSSTSSSTTIIVQSSVTTIQASFSNPVAYPTGRATYTLYTAYPDTVQQVFCSWDFTGDGLVTDVTYAHVINDTFHHTVVHDFTASQMGSLRTAVTCHNLVSTMPLTLDVEVVHVITGMLVLSVSPTPQVDSVLALEPKQEMSIEVQAVSGSAVLFQSDFGGESVQDFRVNGDAEGMSQQFSHTWSSVGNFTVNVSITNAVSGKYQTWMVIVQNPVLSQQVALLHRPHINISPGDIDFKVDVQGAEPVPTDVTATLQPGDGGLPQSQFVARWPALFHQSYTGSPPSSISVCVNLSNLVSMETSCSRLELQEEVSGLSLTTPTSTQVGMDTKLSVSLQAGSHITVSASFGDGNNRAVKYTHIMDQWFEIVYQYQIPGIFPINIIARNDISQVTNTTSLMVANVLEDAITLKGKLPVITPDGAAAKVGEEVYLELTNLLGSPHIIDILVDFGDGTSFQTTDLTLSDVYELNHLYDSIGTYNVTAIIDNGFSLLVLTTKVDIQNSVMTADFRVESPAGNYGYNGYFVVDDPLHFSAIVDGGTDVSFRWTLSDRVVKELRDISFDFAYEYQGIFDVKLVVFNLVSSVVVTRRMNVVSLFLRWFDAVMPAYRAHPVSFVMELSEPTDVCISLEARQFAVDQGQFSLFETRPDLCAKLTEFKGHKVARVVAGTSMSFELEFLQAGFFSVHVFVLSEDPDKQAQAQIHVSVKPNACENPAVTVKPGPGESPDNPLPLAASLPLDVGSDMFTTRMYCQETQSVTPSWRVSRKDAYRWRQLEELPVGSYMSAAGIRLPKNSLAYGLHQIQLLVAMTGLEAFNDSAVIYINIVESPLQAGILGGSGRKVGREDATELNAEELTFDPDVKTRPDPGLKFAWFCHQDGETLPSPPPRVVVPASGTPSGGRGGCFGTGPGQLDVTSGIWSLSPRTLEVGIYVFTLVVRKGTRQATITQTVHVTENSALQLKRRCAVSGACPSHVTPGAPLAVLGSCVNCPDPPTFTWSLKQTTSNQSEADLSQHVHAFTLEGGFLATVQIPAGILQVGSTYRVILHAHLAEVEPGMVYWDISINQPPEGGTCSISPEEGKALESFHVMCRDWSDDDTSATLLTYTYSYITDDVIAAPANPLVLPAGPQSRDNLVVVVVHVIDMLGAVTSVELEVKVLPTSQEALLTQAEQLYTLDPSQAALRIMRLTGTFNAISSSLLVDDQGQVLGKMVDALANVVSPKVSDDSPDGATGQNIVLSANQQKAVLNTVTSLTSTMPTHSTKNSHKNRSLDLISEMGSQLGYLTVSQQEPLVTGSADPSPRPLRLFAEAEDWVIPTLNKNHLLAATGYAFRLVYSTPPVTVRPSPPDLDLVVDEAEEDARKRREEQQLLEQTQLKQKAALVQKHLASGVFAVMRNQAVPGDAPLIRQAGALTAAVAVTSGLTRSSYTLGDTTLTLPRGGAAADNARVKRSGTNSRLMCTQVLMSDYNMYSWEESAGNVTPPILSLSETDTSGESYPLDEPVVLSIPHQGAGLVNTSRALLDDVTGLVYVHLPWSDAQAAAASSREVFLIQLKPTADLQSASVKLFINLGAPDSVMGLPNFTHHDHQVSLPADHQMAPWSWRIPASSLLPPSVFIGFYVNGSSLQPSESGTVTLPFWLHAVLLRCQAWDESSQHWDDSHCQVLENSSADATHCRCEHKGEPQDKQMVSRGISLPKINTIDFKNIASDFLRLLNANPAVFSVIIGVVVAYSILGVWARHADRKDIEKWSVVQLLDNPRPGAKSVPGAGEGEGEGEGPELFHFQLTVFTGLRAGAGTTSRVCCVLAGEDNDTDIRVLEDGNYKGFARGSVRRLLLSTVHALGPLTFLRVWHDSSGTRDQANWFLDKIVVDELKTGTRYYFLCGRWLALDEEDGNIERLLPVAGHEQVVGLRHLFFSSTRRNLTEDHLWVSVFARPTRSSFTRLQRLTTCVAVLFATMLADACWFRADEQEEGEGAALVLGPLVLSLYTVYVSVMASLMAIPVSTVILTLFEKSQPSQMPSLLEKLSQSGAEEDQDVVKEAVKRYKKKYPLPYWCRLLAWILSVLVILTSAAIVIFFSLQWGKVKAEEWLSAFFLSFAQSVFVIQSVKVVVLAMVMAFMFRRLQEDKDDDNRLSADEEFDTATVVQSQKVESLAPLSAAELQRVRAQRLQEKAMWRMLKELGAYLLFLLLLCFIAWGSNDRAQGLLHTQLRAQLQGGAAAHTPLDKVKTFSDFWDWSLETLIPVAVHNRKYNGRLTSLRERQFMADMTSYRLGGMRMRQVRRSSLLCWMPDALLKIGFPCSKEYSIVDEDTANYSTAWRPETATDRNRTVLPPAELAFKYRGVLDLAGFPHWGTFATYGGGGYVADIPNNTLYAHRLVEELQHADWLDTNTRAVFVELTVYNAFVNHFAFVNVVLEFPPLSAIFPCIHVAIFDVYSAVGAMGAIVLVAQILYIFILIYIIGHEALKAKGLGRRYLHSVWNVLEVITIVLSVVAVAMFASKQMYGRYVTQQVHHRKDGLVNFAQLAVYGEVFRCLLGVILFLATIKLLRMLGLNYHIQLLTTTLHCARRDCLYFGLTFFIVYLGFTCMGHMIFGPHSYHFCTVVKTLESLYSMLLGFNIFNDLRAINRVLGPMFFVLYVFIIVFVLVNMFLGILGEAFQKSNTLEAAREDARLWIYMWTRLKVFLRIETKAPGGTGSAEQQNVEHDGKLTSAVRQLEIRLETLLASVSAWHTKANVKVKAEVTCNGIAHNEKSIINKNQSELSKQDTNATTVCITNDVNKTTTNEGETTNQDNKAKAHIVNTGLPINDSKNANVTKEADDQNKSTNAKNEDGSSSAEDVKVDNTSRADDTKELDDVTQAGETEPAVTDSVVSPRHVNPSCESAE